MFNYYTKLLKMEQIRYLDLSTVTLGHNFVIVGFKGSGRKTLRENITHLLKIKNCYVDNPYFMHCFYKSNYIYNNNNKSEVFIIKLYDFNYKPSHFEDLDIVFVHSQYIHKKEVAQDYYNKGYYHPYHVRNNNIDYVNSMDLHSSPYTFFVLRNHNRPPGLCKVEHVTSYFNDFDKMPYNYNNITKLTNNILNKCSSYHQTNGELHKILQLKLKELYKIYCIVFCMKHHEIWLPFELNLKIMKLFYCISNKN